MRAWGSASVTVPAGLVAELRAAAAARGVSLDELVRRIFRLGLLAIALEDAPDASLVVRDAGGERELVL